MKKAILTAILVASSTLTYASGPVGNAPALLSIVPLPDGTSMITIVGNAGVREIFESLSGEEVQVNAPGTDHELRKGKNISCALNTFSKDVNPPAVQYRCTLTMDSNGGIRYLLSRLR